MLSLNLDWDIRHESEVYEGQLALGGDQEVAGVGVRVEEAGLQELRKQDNDEDDDVNADYLDEEALHPHGYELVNHLGRGLGELGALYPLCDQHSPRGVLLIHPGDIDPLSLARLQGLLAPPLVVRLVEVVQLLNELHCNDQ